MLFRGAWRGRSDQAPGKGKLGTLVDKDNFRAQWKLASGEVPACTAHSFVTLDRSPHLKSLSVLCKRYPLQAGKQQESWGGGRGASNERRQGWAVEAALLISYVRT